MIRIKLKEDATGFDDPELDHDDIAVQVSQSSHCSFMFMNKNAIIIPLFYLDKLPKEKIINFSLSQ